MRSQINFAGLAGELEFYTEDATTPCAFRFTNENETVSKVDLLQALATMANLTMLSTWSYGNESACVPGALLKAIESFGGYVEWPTGWCDALALVEADLDDAQY
ncbi:hypothetical protein KW823_21865 [Enterobacter quasiroggenkampii]|nr:hypothetical protein [Enterobacter quasiroggenkampii]